MAKRKQEPSRPVCRERAERRSGRRGSHLRSLPGVVYGPEGIPLCDALVHLPSLNRSTRTGMYGEFNFETVPARGLGLLRVEVEGRGIEIELSAETVLLPLAIHFEMNE